MIFTLSRLGYDARRLKVMAPTNRPGSIKGQLEASPSSQNKITDDNTK